MIGYQEILIIALIILLLFGGKKIPEMMKGMGKGVKSFKDGMKGVDDDRSSSAGSTSSGENADVNKDVKE